MRRLVLLAALVWLMLGGAAWADEVDPRAYLPFVRFSPGLEAAAKSGDPRAQLELATAYMTGDGVDADDDKALDWARQALDDGQVHAACIVGGLQADRGRVSALRYLWLGAEAGFGRCLATLAELYADGAPEIGIQPDPVRERRLSVLCAQLGRFDCQLRLVRMFARLAEDHAQDRRLYLGLAITWLQVARDNPHNDDHAAVWALASKLMHARAVPRQRPSNEDEPRGRAFVHFGICNGGRCGRADGRRGRATAKL